MNGDFDCKINDCPRCDVVIIDNRHYQLGDVIHQGNYSRIHSAELLDSGCGSAFVVKYFVCHFGDEIWHSAIREIEAALMLTGCRHIVKLHGYSIRERMDGIYEIFALMDRLECSTDIFGSYMAVEDKVIKLCRDILKALKFMRRKGLVHGDVKPSNIYYSQSAGWQLGDFGSVTLRGERPKFVSEGYCSPEARRGEVCDIRSDIYSLGITAYKLLSNGRLPFCDKPCELMEDGEVYYAIERRLSGEPIPPIDGVSRKLNNIITKMCEYDPRKRTLTF